jgi:uncharacterized Ntn-hydrolase superfamily protein
MSSEIVATFSVIGADANGDLGVAVASRYFSVGSVVPWVAANIGAVATQASVNVEYGPRALELLKQSMPVDQVLEKIRAEDTFDGRENRQVALIDAQGNVAVHTGPNAPDWAGHKKGKGWSVQGNTLVGPQVIEAMGAAFEAHQGELAEKLYAALQAGDLAGGDSRGRQSAALLVARKHGGRNLNNDRYVWVHVDDHSRPLDELKRLLDLNLAYLNRNRAFDLMAAGNLEQASSFALRAASLAPNHADVRIYAGFLHYLAGDKALALQEFRNCAAIDTHFKYLWDATLNFRPKFREVLGDREFLRQLFP